MHPLASAGPFDRAQGRLILEGVAPANLREGHALPTDFGHGCRFDDLGDLYYYYLANQILGQLAKKLTTATQSPASFFLCGKTSPLGSGSADNLDR